MNICTETNLLLLGVGGTLGFSSLVAGAAHLAVRDTSQRVAIANLIARVKAWWVMTVVSAVAFLAGETAVILLFAFVSFASLREFLTITTTRRGDRAVLLTIFYLVLPVQYLLIWKRWYGLFTAFVPIYVFLVLPILATVAADTRNFLARIAEIQWGVMICVYCISYVPALLAFPISGRLIRGSSGADSISRSALLVVFLLVITQSSDIMQYVFGKLFGKRRILPVISPSKTAEGLFGGLASAAALGAGLCWITPFTRWQGGAMALLIASAGFLGGLVMSAIKRDRSLKDWGHLITGHGGMLDRMDSVCFAAPIFFHLARFVAGSQI